MAEAANCFPQTEVKKEVIHARRVHARVHLLAVVTNTKVCTA